MDIDLIVVGMGGIGSFLMAPLSKALIDGRLGTLQVCTLLLVDGDRYEDHNRSRQFFPAVCSGMNKAEAQKLVLTTMFPNTPVSIHTLPQYLTEEEDVRGILRGSDNVPVILSLVDNHACRALLSRMMSQYNIGSSGVLITGGNEVTTGNATIQGRLHKRRVGVNLLTRHPEIATSKEGSREGLSCAEITLLPGGEQTMEANMMVAMSIYSMLLRLDDNTWVAEVSDIYFDTNPPAVHTVFRGKEETTNDYNLDDGDSDSVSSTTAG